MHTIQNKKHVNINYEQPIKCHNVLGHFFLNKILHMNIKNLNLFKLGQDL